MDETRSHEHIRRSRHPQISLRTVQTCLRYTHTSIHKPSQIETPAPTTHSLPSLTHRRPSPYRSRCVHSAQHRHWSADYGPYPSGALPPLTPAGATDEIFSVHPVVLTSGDVLACMLAGTTTLVFPPVVYTPVSKFSWQPSIKPAALLVSRRQEVVVYCVVAGRRPMVMLQDPWDRESGRVKSSVMLGVSEVWKWVELVVLGKWESADWQSEVGARPGSPGKRHVGGLATG